MVHILSDYHFNDLNLHQQYFSKLWKEKILK